MRITRAESPDGRIFRAANGGYHQTRITAKAKPVPAVGPSAPVSPTLARIMRPQAAYRWLLPSVAAITPQYVEMVLRGALAGNHVQQWELFDLMLDTWPELAACSQELIDGVACQKMIFQPFAEEDEDPTPEAIERCKLVSAALRRMAPDAAADENDREGTVADLIDGWFRGVTCLEIDWHAATSATHGTMIAPRCTFWVHPVCFAFDQNGRLGLRVDAQGQMSPSNIGGTALQSQPAVVGAFPPNKFLVGIHKAKSGTALGGAILRPLAWWWCAANFSADWLLNLAQIFGLPFRWANYDPSAAEETVNSICAMLQNMGSAGWAAFPAGTTMEMIETGKQGSDHSPQGELLDRADRYARLVILGQTMSGSQDSSKGGGKAFGAVESDVKARRIEAAGRYACRVLTTQLIPSILMLNYGDTDEAPTIALLEEEEAGSEEAKRDQTLAAAGLKIGVNYLRKKYDIPAPAEGEETIGGTAAVDDETNDGEVWDDGDEEDEPLASGEGAGHMFRGNQYTQGIHVTLPDEHWTGTPNEMRDRADAIMRGFGPVQHPVIGTVEFSRSGRRKTLQNKSDPHRLQSVQALPEIIAKGKLMKSEPDVKGRSEIKQFHTLEAGLRIGNTRYRAEVVIKEFQDRKTVSKFYLHRLHDAKALKTKSAARAFASPALRPGRAPSGNGETTPAPGMVKRLGEIAAIADDDAFARELRALIES